MSREIKFRAWDRDKKKWVNSDEIPVTGERDDYFEICCNGYLEVMQYTGLKDKGGVEIYEGDIIRVRFNNDHIMNLKVKFEVGAFGVAGYYLKSIRHESEVIGNVYENKELLDG